MEAYLGGYARRSRALGDPENDPSILESQVAAIRRLAVQDGRNLTTEKLRLEVGSGEYIESRPVFRELLSGWERLPRGAGGLLYVTEVTRLSRGDLSEFGRIEGALRRAAVKVATCGRRYDLEREEDRFMFRMEALFANKEHDRAKERLARGRLQKRQKGGLANAVPPFGYLYSLEHKTLLPHPERFEILRRSCHEALTVSVKRLAERYDVPENCLRRALRNPTICGWPARHYGPRDPDNPCRKSYVPIPRASWEWPEVANSRYPHACSRDEWELLQLTLDRRRDTRARTHRLDGWCRDVLEFSGYPGPVRLGGLVTSQRKSGNLHMLTYERKVPDEPFLYVARAVVHDTCRSHLAHLVQQTSLLAQALAEFQERQSKEKANQGRERDAQSAQRSLADARRRYQDAVDAEMDAEGPMHRYALTVRRRRLEENVGRLEKELHELQSHPADPPGLPDLVEALPLLGRNFDPFWASWDGNRKRAVVNVCFSAMEVTISERPTPQAYAREVTRIEYQPWLHSLFGEWSR